MGEQTCRSLCSRSSTLKALKAMINWANMQLLEAAAIPFFELRIIFLLGKNVTLSTTLSLYLFTDEVISPQISLGLKWSRFPIEHKSLCCFWAPIYDHRGHGSKTKKNLCHYIWTSAHYIWSSREQTAAMLKDKDKGNTNIWQSENAIKTFN